MSRPRLVALLLALATLVVFLPAARFEFLNYDDNDYVTENVFVKNGLTLGGIQWAFTAFHAGNWHPLTWLSHMADCELFKLNAGAHHFINILFHAANAALLFALLWRLTEKIWPSALIAALFAWHPLHVESVAWIAERKDVLSTFFALLALIAYARFVAESKVQSPKSKVFFAASLLCFALGLLAKPMLVTLPFVMLLLDFWPLQRFQISNFKFQIVLEKIPFFLLTAISCVVTFFAQRHGEAVVSLAKVSLRYRLENAPVAVVKYILNFFWPAHLCAIYPMPEKISAFSVALAVAALALITIAAWRGRNSQPYFLTGWLWFLGTLVPVIGLVQVGGQAMADRYTYIPSIGFFIAAVFLAQDLAARFQIPKTVLAGTSILLLAGCVCATEFQLQFWRDSETLFRRAVAVTQNNDIALVNLGVALEEQNRFPEALEIYRQAEKLESGRYQLHNNLGSILDKLGRPAESLAEYREAIRLRPGSSVLHNAAGSELAALGDFDEALKEFAEAERLDAQYPWPHVETAKVFLKQGRDDAAVDELRAALRIAPENFQILAYTAHVLAANENAAARDGRAALTLATKANILTGGSQPMVFDALGMALAETGDFTNALTCAQNALDLATAAQMKNLEPIQKRLALYQARQPWRESFRATNAPAAKN
jgi:tetratricopeptide (TPR) repeat protein